MLNSEIVSKCWAKDNYKPYIGKEYTADEFYNACQGYIAGRSSNPSAGLFIYSCELDEARLFTDRTPNNEFIESIVTSGGMAFVSDFTDNEQNLHVPVFSVLPHA